MAQDGPPATRSDRVANWLRLLPSASDDSMRARIVSRLVTLGSWPAEIDEMSARSIIPARQVELFKVTFQANAPAEDNALGLAKMRQLARSSVMGAIALLHQLDADNDPSA